MAFQLKFKCALHFHLISDAVTRCLNNKLPFSLLSPISIPFHPFSTSNTFLATPLCQKKKPFTVFIMATLRVFRQPPNQCKIVQFTRIFRIRINYLSMSKFGFYNEPRNGLHLGYDRLRKIGK